MKGFQQTAMQNQTRAAKSPISSLWRRGTPAGSTTPDKGNQYVSVCENIRNAYDDVMTVYGRSSQSHKSDKPGYWLGFGAPVNNKLNSLKGDLKNAVEKSPWREQSQISKENEDQCQKGRRKLPLKDIMHLVQETTRYKAVLVAAEKCLDKLVGKSPKIKGTANNLHKSFRYDYEKICNFSQPLGCEFLLRLKEQTEEEIMARKKAGSKSIDFAPRFLFSQMALPHLGERILLVEEKLKLLQEILGLLVDIALFSSGERRDVQEKYGLR